MRTRITARPPVIVYGAAALAGLSLLWSGYAITDLMHSGRFGLSVALAGDIGWITVLWAEYRGITVRVKGKDRSAAPAGWIIALGVAALLALHGHDVGSTAQATAGPFIVLVGKIVWVFALASLRDPAALTPEQEAEIASVMRDSEYEARLHQAHLDRLDRSADAEIARIRSEARIVLARDDTDAEIRLERIDKGREIERRTPLAINPPPARDHTDHAPEQIANTPIAAMPAPASTSANADREQPRMVDVVREQIAISPNNADAVRAVLEVLPGANPESVAAAVRRGRREMKGGYA
ncbi:hypothetical protein [Streptomyces goshikiensis]